jgi:hypothetical protein
VFLSLKVQEFIYKRKKPEALSWKFALFLKMRLELFLKMMQKLVYKI